MVSFPVHAYWVGDTRTLNRISLYGYTDYAYDLSRNHLTDLPDRSWWPVFPVLTSGMIALTGDGVCAGRTVNSIAVILLIPVIQAITGTRRLEMLLGLMIIPFALWLYVAHGGGCVFARFGHRVAAVSQNAPGTNSLAPSNRIRHPVDGHHCRTDQAKTVWP